MTQDRLAALGITAALGILFLGFFGLPLYNWWLGGQLTVPHKYGHEMFVTLAGDPITFIMSFGFYAMLAGVGLFLIAVAACNYAIYLKHRAT